MDKTRDGMKWIFDDFHQKMELLDTIISKSSSAPPRPTDKTQSSAAKKDSFCPDSTATDPAWLVKLKSLLPNANVIVYLKAVPKAVDFRIQIVAVGILQFVFRKTADGIARAGICQRIRNGVIGSHWIVCGLSVDGYYYTHDSVFFFIILAPANSKSGGRNDRTAAASADARHNTRIRGQISRMGAEYI